MAAKRSPPPGTIPFIESRFFDPNETRRALEERFERHLRTLRARGLSADALTDYLLLEEGSDDPDITTAEADALSVFHLSPQDRERIGRRAKCIIAGRQATNVLRHLKREDQVRLEVLRDGVRLIAIPSEHRADELAAALHADMPWMAPATEIVWQAMRRSVREGWTGLRLPPLLLDGPPGIGKSHWARRLGQLLSAPTTVIEATGENTSFGIVGCQRGWSTASPGRLLETVLHSLVGNPVMVVDEIEKAGTAVSSEGQSFGLAEGLLPLLEPLTAKRWNCPYFHVKFDMSWVIWILTANTSRHLPAPLLNRCPPIRLRDLTLAELDGFIRREGANRGLSDPAIDAIGQALADPSVGHHRPSLRVAARMLQRATDLEHTPPLH